MLLFNYHYFCIKTLNDVVINITIPCNDHLMKLLTVETMDALQNQSHSDKLHKNVANLFSHHLTRLLENAFLSLVIK